MFSLNKGLIEVCMCFGQSIGQFYGGFLFQRFGFQGPYLATATLNLLTFILCIIAYRKINIRRKYRVLIHCGLLESLGFWLKKPIFIYD